MRQIKLTPEEQEIEDHVEDLVPASTKELERFNSIVERARKTRSISLRISSYDLDQLKIRAQEEGLAYQTLINTVLHKYVTNQLYDRKEVVKTVNAMRDRKGNIT